MAGWTSRNVGTAGTMSIYDNGTNGVEFLIGCSDGATFVNQYTWTGVVNGVGVGATITLPSGFGQRSLGSWTVTTSQTVSWHQNNTGTSGLGGAADISAFVSRATVPSTPATPSASSIATTSMTLNWSIPSNGGAGIDQMLLRRNTSSPVEGSGYVDYPNGGSVTSRSVTGLSAGQKYYWVVYAHNAVGYSNRSGELFAPTLPAAPTTPTTSSVASTSMTVAWTKGSNGDAITGYDLQIDDNSSFSSPTTYSLTGTSRSMTGLTQGTTYYFRVRAKTASGTGAFSGTKTQATTLGTPGSLAYNSVTPTSLTLTWSAVAGASSYDIQYSTNSSFSSATTVTSTTTSRSITGLTPGATYYFRVRAKTSDVTGAWSTAINTATPPSTAPGMTVVADASGQSATVSLTPPGGATGVTKYTVERRIGTGTATSTDTTTSPLTVNGLTPGTTYQWRASAWFGTYQSPWTSWTSLTQPNPNTNPGDYFDGSTAARTDLTFSWTGTANNSTSNATGVGVTGWAQDGGGSGATVRHQRVTGGRFNSYSCRMLVITDATTAGAGIGMQTSGGTWSAVIEAGAIYVGSMYVRPSRAQRLRLMLSWTDSTGTGVGSPFFSDELYVTNTTNWTRLWASGVAPDGATRAVVKVYDVSGTGWSTWKSGDFMDADGAMVSLATLFDWFSGSTPDTAEFDYQWLGTPNASVSARFEKDPLDTDPLADPDCPPLPTPPSLPTIEADCIDEVGTWRRYTLEIPASEVRLWSSTLPTLILETGNNSERQVRIRYYPNPNNLSPELVTQDGWEAELILTYIPPNTVLTMDGVTQTVLAEVNGGDPISANRLLYGTGGVPATWPELRCGIGYVVTMDVPLEAPAGNLDARVIVTQRM